MIEQGISQAKVQSQVAYLDITKKNTNESSLTVCWLKLESCLWEPIRRREKFDGLFYSWPDQMTVNYPSGHAIIELRSYGPVAGWMTSKMTRLQEIHLLCHPITGQQTLPLC